MRPGARRPDGKARGARISGICKRRATPPAGMPRPGIMLRITGAGHYDVRLPGGTHMKRILVLACAIVVASAVPALAQKALAEALARSAATSLRNIAESAEKMPEAEYGFQA